MSIDKNINRLGLLNIVSHLNPTQNNLKLRKKNLRSKNSSQKENRKESPTGKHIFFLKLYSIYNVR